MTNKQQFKEQIHDLLYEYLHEEFDSSNCPRLISFDYSLDDGGEIVFYGEPDVLYKLTKIKLEKCLDD